MGDAAGKTAFYSNAEDYWREVPPTVDGMLGGYGSISSIDINGSKNFLLKFLGVRHFILAFIDLGPVLIDLGPFF